MSADPSQETETRIVLPLDLGKLVIFFSDTFRLAPADSDELLVKSLRTQKPDANPSKLTVGPLQIVLQRPQRWAEVISDGELVEDALIVLPDQTVVNAGFFVTPYAKDKERLRTFARDWLRTLTAGNPSRGGEVLS